MNTNSCLSNEAGNQLQIYHLLTCLRVTCDRKVDSFCYAYFITLVNSELPGTHCAKIGILHFLTWGYLYVARMHRVIKIHCNKNE